VTDRRETGDGLPPRGARARITGHVAFDAGSWSDFALAQLGASAALLGLVFVGTRVLVNRALEAIVLLASVLMTATAVPIPGQSGDACAIEIIGVGVVTGLVVLRLQSGVRVIVVPHGDRGPTWGSVMSRRLLAVLLAFSHRPSAHVTAQGRQNRVGTEN
jgi:hypothetical protein